MDIFAVVVIYNRSCADSETCRALAGCRVPVLIYDNSTRDMGNEAQCREKGWTYLGGKGNDGISKAYNGCIDHLKQQGKQGYLCLLDDDTQVSQAYFDAISSQTEKIAVPLIYSAGRLLSPCRLSKGHRSRLFSDEKQAMEYTGSDISAINSGMAVELSLFDGYRYDENIFLDGVDHTFLRDMAAKGHRPKVMNFSFTHEFSGDSKPPKAAALNRFRIYVRDYRYILREDFPAYLALVGRRMLHLTVQYGSLDFFRAFLACRKGSK